MHLLLVGNLLGDMFFIICRIAFGAFKLAAEKMEEHATELEALKGLQRDAADPSKLELVLEGLAERNAVVVTRDAAGARTVLASLVDDARSNFDRRRADALRELTGTDDAGRTTLCETGGRPTAAVLVRRTTGTGKDTRYVGGGPNAEEVRGQYKADDAQAFQDQEGRGTEIYAEKRERFQRVLRSGRTVKAIFMPAAVTVGDYLNQRPLLVSGANPTGFVRMTLTSEDCCRSRSYIPGRAALAGCLALLIVLIQLTVHWKLGSFTTLTSAKDVLALLVTPATIQSYLTIFCTVTPRWAINYGRASGVLIGGVATYFIYKVEGTDEWVVVDRGEASDAGGGELSTLRYRVPCGDDWDTTPDISSYSLVCWAFFGGLSALWQMVLSACSGSGNVKKTKRELREQTDAQRAGWADAALQLYADGGSQPKLVQVVGGVVSSCVEINQ